MITRRPKANRDCGNGNDFSKYNINPDKIECPSHGMYTEQPRAINPAWNLRGIESERFHILLNNPQEKIEIPFSNNLHSRIIEKDDYVKNLS